MVAISLSKLTPIWGRSFAICLSVLFLVLIFSNLLTIDFCYNRVFSSLTSFGISGFIRQLDDNDAKVKGDDSSEEDPVLYVKNIVNSLFYFDSLFPWIFGIIISFIVHVADVPYMSFLTQVCICLVYLTVYNFLPRYI